MGGATGVCRSRVNETLPAFFDREFRSGTGGDSSAEELTDERAGKREPEVNRVVGRMGGRGPKAGFIGERVRGGRRRKGGQRMRAIWLTGNRESIAFAEVGRSEFAGRISVANLGLNRPAFSNRFPGLA